MFKTALIYLVCSIGSLSSATAADPFVTVNEGRFVLAGEPHRFVGANFWQAMNMAADGPGGDRKRLAAELDHMQQLGVTNLRVMAASEGPDTEPQRMTPVLMIAPRQYDVQVFDGLDYLVAQAAARGMHLVMVLNNYWHWSGGIAQYVSWQEGSPIPYPTPNDWKTFGQYSAKFYTYPQCQWWYRDHIATLINHVNPYTGRKYRDEPAIFAWELANEPRNYPAEWIDETAAFIKKLDSNHLVTTGSEGSVGGDFRGTHDGPHIDYATVHIWPQNWGWYDPSRPESYTDAESQARAYFASHVADAAALGEPLVLEEFGLARDWAPSHNLYDPAASTALRDQFYAAMFDETLASASSGGPAAGTNFWAWSGQARPGDRWIGDPPHEQAGWYSVYASDQSTLRIIADHASRLTHVDNDRDGDGDFDLVDFADLQSSSAQAQN